MPEEDINNPEEGETEETGEFEEDEGPKISLPEGIIMVLISLVAEVMDIVGSLTVFLTPLSWISDLTNLAIIQIWLIIKGGIGFRKQAVALTGNLIELIPVLDILPVRTATLLVAIYLINHPKAAKIAAPAKK
ncbi:MAG: hypothetical protein AAB651_00655 [Patescibacteria group bacterium]